MTKGKKRYHVVMVHNFDLEIGHWEFDRYDKAKAFLHWKWEDYYNTEIAESYVALDCNICFHEDEYARVGWENKEYTEFILISETDDIPEEFEKVWRRYV